MDLTIDKGALNRPPGKRREGRMVLRLGPLAGIPGLLGLLMPPASLVVLTGAWKLPGPPKSSI